MYNFKYPDDFINKIIHGDCIEVMNFIPENAIDIIITSPPYYNAKDYANYETYASYLDFLNNVIDNCYWILKPNGRICINVPDGYGRNPWVPVYADVINIIQNIGFIPRGSIVWNKGTSAGKTSWGSWRSSSNPCLIDEHEKIIIAHKKYPKIDGSKLERDDFMTYMHSVWNIAPQVKSKHPAPFPLEIPNRLIKFYSTEKSIVLDPFVGSGTTCVAAKMNNRNYIGIDISFDYCEMAERRIKEVS